MRRQLRLHRQRLAVRQKIQKALVHRQQRADRLAFRQNPPHQRPVRRLPRRVVRLAEEHDLHRRLNRAQNILGQRKIVRFVQRVAANVAADRFQRRLVFRERRRENQRMLWPFGQREPENQIRRAVSAENPILRNAFRLAERRAKLAAERVGIAIRPICRRADGPRHRLRRPQRADVGRKIQRVPPVFLPIADGIAAMHQPHRFFTPKSI